MLLLVLPVLRLETLQQGRRPHHLLMATLLRRPRELLEMPRQKGERQLHLPTSPHRHLLSLQKVPKNPLQKSQVQNKTQLASDNSDLLFSMWVPTDKTAIEASNSRSCSLSFAILTPSYRNQLTVTM